MELTVKKDAAELARAVAAQIKDYINQSPGALLCFAAGDTPLAAYAHLIALQAAGQVNLSSVYYVGLDEWVGLGYETRGSCAQVMFDHYYTPAGIPRERIDVFNGLNPDLEEEKARIERWIRDRGGIGLTLLGIGMNGHVGFNEPGAGLPMGCIDAPLDDTTKRVSSKYFDSPLPVKRGIGVGAGTLKRADRLILMADGARKAEIVYRTLREPPTDRVPASLMADHPNASIFLDEAAAALVRDR